MVSPEMLMRYYQGKCTPQESRLVEHWLDSTDDSMDLVGEEEAVALEEKMWRRIKLRSIGLAATNWSSYIHYSAAACVALLLGTFIYFQMVAVPVEGTGKVVEVRAGQKEIAPDLQATALGDSSLAMFKLIAGDGAGAIRFCGALRVVNNSTSSKEYVFESACKSSAYTQKRVTLKPGKTYIVLHNFYKTYEVIVMSKEQMQQFPDAFTPEIQREFRI